VRRRLTFCRAVFNSWIRSWIALVLTCSWCTIRSCRSWTVRSLCWRTGRSLSTGT